MRMPRGISIAAAMTKLSSAPLTMLADEPATIGASASTPAISVIEPPSRRASRAASARLTWPISLLIRPRPYGDCASGAGAIAASGGKLTLPAAQTTASSGPAASRPATMLAGSAMSMRIAPDFEPAATMSWRAPSSATTARPSSPLAPMTRMRKRGASDIPLFSLIERRRRP